MGRKILLQEGESHHLLEETDADNEAQLQELLKDNPHLLPIEEFELTGPMMLLVVKRPSHPEALISSAFLARATF